MGTLRLMLALAVVVGHSGGLHGLRLADGTSAILPSGQVAVQAFYLISGFYMECVRRTRHEGLARAKTSRPPLWGGGVDNHQAQPSRATASISTQTWSCPGLAA